MASKMDVSHKVIRAVRELLWEVRRRYPDKSPQDWPRQYESLDTAMEEFDAATVDMPLVPTPAPVAPPAPTPAPEVCCASPLCPHPPAPEAKRPTHVRITGPKGQLSVTIGKVYEVLYFDDDRARLIIKNDDGVEWGLSNKPDEGPAFPTWAPAPCPPPVAGSAEDDVERAARALVENRGATYSVATNPPSKFVMIPSAYFEALRAALSRPVRP